MLVSFEEKVLATIAVLLLVAAIVIGFSDRSVAIAGAEYSCGSGFVHNTQTWRADSAGLPAGRTPSSVCPSKVAPSRNIAIVLGVLAVVSAVVVFGLGDRSTVGASARSA